MKLIVCKNYDEMSAAAAKELAAEIKAKPDLVLGLPTGSTPVGMYKKLIEMNKNGEVDFARVTTFNLDEYYPIKKEDNQSYHYFMYDNLFSHINIDHKNVHIPNGEAQDVEAFCAQYEKMILDAGGLDIQVLGAGVNGHIGFNEPASELVLDTHKTDLTANTIEVNSRFFDKLEDVPTKAVTMGVGTIMKAKKIITLISGSAKAPVIDAMFGGTVTTEIPATLLALHQDAVIIADEAAAINQR